MFTMLMTKGHEFHCVNECIMYLVGNSGWNFSALEPASVGQSTVRSLTPIPARAACTERVGREQVPH